MSFTVRIGIKADLPKVMELIMELAKYENGEDQVSNSLEMMEKDGFGENPIYRFSSRNRTDISLVHLSSTSGILPGKVGDFTLRIL